MSNCPGKYPRLLRRIRQCASNIEWTTLYIQLIHKAHQQGRLSDKKGNINLYYKVKVIKKYITAFFILNLYISFPYFINKLFLHVKRKLTKEKMKKLQQKKTTFPVPTDPTTNTKLFWKETKSIIITKPASNRLSVFLGLSLWIKCWQCLKYKELCKINLV